jgi:RNA polymerase-binding protein DksA
MTPPDLDLDHFSGLLLAERAQISRALVAIHADSSTSLEDATGELNSSSVDDHLADLASETHDREVEYGLEENGDEVVLEIDAALKRIDDGTYGSCTACGKSIGKERLEARPWATLCIDDQRRLELG